MPTTSAGYYYADGSTPMSAEAISAAEATAAQEVYDGLVEDSYLFRETVYFTTTDSFDKGDYPWLRAIRVRLVGGGGGSGGCESTGSGAVSQAGNGGGGEYAEKFVTDISSLGSSETIEVGAGGLAGTASGNGGDGGTSTAFGVSAAGGGGGVLGTPGSPPGHVPGAPGEGGTGGAGVADLRIAGDSATSAFAQSTARVYPGSGGRSFVGANTSQPVAGSGGTVGKPGVNYGGGALGPTNTPSLPARAGQAGAPGIVIVELFG